MKYLKEHFLLGHICKNLLRSKVKFLILNFWNVINQFQNSTKKAI